MAIAITADDHGTFTAGTSTTKTFSFTAPNGSDALVVFIMAYHGEANPGQPNTITGITFHGETMTFGARSENINDQKEWVDAYYMVNPDTGSAYDVAVTFGSAGNNFGSDIIVVALSGVDQTTPLEDADGHYEASSGDNISTSVTSTATGVAVDGILNANSVAMTQGGGQTVLHEGLDLGGSERIGSSYKANASSMSWSWTGANNRRAHAVLVFKEQAATPPDELMSTRTMVAVPTMPR